MPKLIRSCSNWLEAVSWNMCEHTKDNPERFGIAICDGAQLKEFDDLSYCDYRKMVDSTLNNYNPMPNVSVPSAWLERLRKLGSNVTKETITVVEEAGRTRLSYLLGYIESSEAFGEGEDPDKKARFSTPSCPCPVCDPKGDGNPLIDRP